MELTMEHIIGSILAARTLTDDEKRAMLDKFQDPAVTNEEISATLSQLAEKEIALREEENRNLASIAAENAAELEREEAAIQPEVNAINEAAESEATAVAQEYVQATDALDAELSKIVESVKRDEHESDEMDAIRAGLGISAK